MSIDAYAFAERALAQVAGNLAKLRVIRARNVALLDQVAACSGSATPTVPILDLPEALQHCMTVLSRAPATSPGRVRARKRTVAYLKRVLFTLPVEVAR